VSDTTVYRRIVRRETHSSRSGLAVVLALLLAVAFAWLGTEAVLAAVGSAPLLLAPADLVGAVLGAAAGPVGLVTAVAVVVALVGLVLVVLALAPGRKGRRGSAEGRSAVVVDDRVIARSLARTAATAGDLGQDQVSVSVGGRRATVEVTELDGRTADAHAVERAVAAELDGYRFGPSLTANVRTKKGRVTS